MNDSELCSKMPLTCLLDNYIRAEVLLTIIMPIVGNIEIVAVE